MKTGIVQRIFNDHFDDYQKHRAVSYRELYAANSIMTCRTEAQGYHISACPNGDYQTINYNSCKHRGCPQCGATGTEVWLERRKARALSCKYFQVIFTISHDLHIIWKYNRKLFTSTMMRAAWHSLRELLLDWKYLGALVGAVGVFQSWGDEMNDHCHLHFIVTAGGLNSDSRWVSVDNDFLLPTPVLASKFRGKFIAYLREGFSNYTKTGQPKTEDQVLKAPTGMTFQHCINLLNKLGRKRWHAQIEPPYDHANGVFKYVGRYIRRGPISERRIVAYDGNLVTIAYAHPKKHNTKTFSLPVHSFIHRLLSHVPERGSHVARTYGLFHPNCVEKLNTARKLLGQGPYIPMLKVPGVMELLARMFPKTKKGRCPHCKTELRMIFYCRGGHVPTWGIAA